MLTYTTISHIAAYAVAVLRETTFYPILSPLILRLLLSLRKKTIVGLALTI